MKTLRPTVRSFLAIFLFASLSIGSVVYALSDINGHRYEEAIEFLVEEDVVGGYNDGTFRPDNTLNRAELLKIIIESVYSDEFNDYTNDSCYSDVPSAQWFTPYVCYASAIGVVEGYDDGTFRPAQEVNFVEALKIILGGFGIAPEVSDTSYYWYQPYVEYAGYNHYIPLDMSTFAQSLTRAQASEILTRMLKNESGELLDYLDEDYDKMVTYLTLSYGFNVESEHLIFEQKFLNLVNTHRLENGAGALELNEDLSALALEHSRYMNDEGKLTHYGDDDADLSTRCAAAELSCSAENVADHGLPSSEVFFELWKLSTGHNQNMIDPNHTELGVAMSGEYATVIFN